MLNRGFYIFALMMFFFNAFSQNSNYFYNNGSENYLIRSVNDLGAQGIEIEFNVNIVNSNNVDVVGQTFQKLFIKDFSKTTEVGKPEMPRLNQILAIPENSEIQIEILDSDVEVFDNFNIFPAQKPLTDRYGDKAPPFEIDENFYNQNIWFPKDIMSCTEKGIVKDIEIGVFQFCPVQYNPATKQLKVYKSVRVKISFNSENGFLKTASHSKSSILQTSNILLNRESFLVELDEVYDGKEKYRSNNDDPNYLILTHADFKQAADSLAIWKQQLGYRTEVISRNNWASKDVKALIKELYDSYNPKPEYFVIIGDHDDVPGENLSVNGEPFASDHYYGCFDGVNDHFPDIAHGRISVSSSVEALQVVQKIINYERYPINDQSFYRKGTNCAQFQDDGEKSPAVRDGYADRRFSLTSEDVLHYMTDSMNFNVERIYATESAVTPRYWNNGTYAAGEPLDSSLLKPNFAWDGDKDDIANAVNNGTLYLLHRDHGYAGGSGWHMPYFVSTNVKSLLSNGNKLPIVFSINCHTGEYQLSECFAEAFLRHTNGGAAGVFAAAYYSYSGYNDALTLGLFDAIWAKPGIVPVFTGNGGISNPTLTSHENIYTMGDVLNQGLMRMVETWGDNAYTFELFHYFGDPTTKIWTETPKTITAIHPGTLPCKSTSLTISNINLTNGKATLMVDGEVLAFAEVNGSSLTFEFDSIIGKEAVLTISSQNYKPYIASITITGGCPKSRFSYSAEQFCTNKEITFSDLSSGQIVSYSWDFGKDASPSAATTAGPHDVIYTTFGEKTITLKVYGNGETHVSSETIFIDEYCSYQMPKAGKESIVECSGKLYDDGGVTDYSNQTNVLTTIAPSGAKSVSLNFISFDFEKGFDSIIVYNGYTISSSKIIGSYSGFDLPNGGRITSNEKSITIQQVTDQGLNRPGFELIFQCNYSNQAPIANFNSYVTKSCNGNIDFYDWSANEPTSWHWDFGDGQSSSDQNPKHFYENEGKYKVQLIVSNDYGSDTIIKDNYISIEMPVPPIIENGDMCGPAKVILSAETYGMVEWYDSILNGTLLHKGTTFETPYLNQTTTYYVQSNSSIHKAGPKDNQFGSGSNFNYANKHGLIFNAYKPFLLKSVLVYASGGKDRKIELQDQNGLPILEKTVFIPDGESRIDLDFYIPAGSGYKLLGPESPNLYRNRTGANYPYEIDGIISIYNSTASTEGYYYYFYDWEIEEDQKCFSQRIPITAFIRNDKPITEFSFDKSDTSDHYIFMNNSTDFQNFSWDFGDGTTDTENIHPVHKFDEEGKYTVSLISYNACGNSSISHEVDVVNDIQEIKDLEFEIYPNPNNGSFYIVSNLNLGNIDVIIYDINGRLLEEITNIELSKLNKFEISLKSLTKGIYLIKIISEEKSIIKKVVIE